MVSDSEFCVEIPRIENEDELKSYTRLQMMQILANQQAIVKSKQESYMQGHGRYPQNEVQGLRTIIACLNAITEKGGQALDIDKLNSEFNN
jgi:hypothetical protein